MNNANLVLSFVGLCLFGLEFGNATYIKNNGPSVALTRQAVELGMEPAALSELWRTKQPVIISKPDALGQLCTTTYELSPDGQTINHSTVKEEQHDATTHSSPVAMQPTNPQTDWEYLPTSLSNKRTYTISSTSPFGGNWPNFGSGFPQWTNLHRDNDSPSFDFPAGVTPQTSIRTEKDDQGRTITTTTKTYKGPVTSNWGTATELGANWPRFEFPAGVTPQTSIKTEKDDQGRTVTTTTKTYKGPVTSNWGTATELGANWPSFKFPAGVTPQTSTKTDVDDQGRTVTRTTSTFRGPVSTIWSPGADATVAAVPAVGQPKSSIFDHPLPHWLNNPLYVDGATAKMPSFTSTAAQPLPENSPLPGPALNNSVDKVQEGTGIRTTTPLPSLDDFLKQTASQTTPKTVDTIDMGNLNPTTRVTNYRSPFDGFPPLPTPPSKQAASSDAEPSEQNQQQKNAIDNYLSQVNLSPEQILARNGEFVKTIVDKDGRVLSARFVLSTVKGNEQSQGQSQGQSELPTK